MTMSKFVLFGRCCRCLFLASSPPTPLFALSIAQDFYFKHFFFCSIDLPLSFRPMPARACHRDRKCERGRAEVKKQSK